MKSTPSLFVSHGAPTFAVEPGIAGPRLSALGRALTPPTAVLIVSPHWQTAQPRVTAADRPQIIHDFGGFGKELYEIDYPANGHPVLAERTVALLRDAGWDAQADERRGLDHGAWVPLLYLFPQADVPVIQVSMPSGLDAEASFALGRALAPLSAQGVLIVGSGSLTHNLYEFRSAGPDAAYAAEFAAWVREAIASGDTSRLIQALDIAPHAHRAHPTAEHFLPLLVAAGAAVNSQPVTVIEGGLAHGVLAMDAFLFGDAVTLS